MSRIAPRPMRETTTRTRSAPARARRRPRQACLPRRAALASGFARLAGGGESSCASSFGSLLGLGSAPISPADCSDSFGPGELAARLAQPCGARLDHRRGARAVHGDEQADDEEERQQRDEELRPHRARRHPGRRAAERAQRARQMRCAARGASAWANGGSATALAFGQRRHERGLQLREHDDIADIKQREHEAREEGAGVELHHRHAGGCAVDDEQHRRRDQDPEAAARGDRRRPRPGCCSRPSASAGTRAGPSA